MRQIAIITLGLLASVAITACGGPTSSSSGGPGPGSGNSSAEHTCPVEGGPLVLALGARQGAPDPTALPEHVVDRIDATIDRHAPITVIETDGRPGSLGSAGFESTANNEAHVRIQRNAFIEELNATMSSAHATHAQADPLGGLQLAASSLRDGGTGGVIIMSDNGLSTVPPLDFTPPGMLNADPDDVVSFLESQGELPDLRGMSVVFYGIGDTDAGNGQKPLPKPAQDHLTAIWVAIAQAGNADCVRVVSTPNDAPARPQSVPVATVDPPAPTTFNPVTPTSVRLPNDATFGFIPGTSELRNPSAAADGVDDLITWLTADPTHRHVTLVGTTARWGDFASYQVPLSQRRATAIEALLVAGGVNARQVNTIGMGSHFPGYVEDQGPDGTLLPAEANANRSVIIKPSGDR